MRPHRRQPIRLHCPWDSPGKNTGVGCHLHLEIEFNVNQILEINRHGKKGKEIWLTEGKVELQCNSCKILATPLGSLEHRQSKLSILEYRHYAPQWLGLYTSTWPVIGCRLSWTGCVLDQGNCLQLGLTLKGLTGQQAFPWRGIIVAHVHIHYILYATQIHFFKYIQIYLESYSSRILMYLSSQKKLKRKKSVGQIIAPSARVGLKTITDTYCLPLKKFWILLSQHYLTISISIYTSISPLLLIVVTYLMELPRPSYLRSMRFWTSCFLETKVADMSLYHHNWP